MRMKSKTKPLGKQGAIERLRDDLVSQIRCGELKPDMPIRSAADLSTLYGISYPTVHRILTDLVQEGLIYRIQGRGTYVARRNAEPAAGNPVVGVFMRSAGDLFGPLFSHLSNALQSAGLLCMASDPQTDMFTQSPEACLDDVLKSKPSALIVEGMAPFPFSALKKREADIPNLVFIHMMQTELHFDADAILSDFERGGYLAARHLLELGHRRLAVEIYGAPDGTTTEWQHSRDRLRGCLQACREHGVPDGDVAVLDAKQGSAPVRALLKSPARPTAVVASTDFEASKLMAVVQATKLRIPEDVSIVGCFNTSWCERLSPPLTSVSIREEVIARRAVACVLERLRDPDAPSVRMLLEPALVARGSTAAPALSRARCGV